MNNDNKINPRVFPILKMIQTWAYALGFQSVGITDPDLSVYSSDFQTWLEKQYHGSMQYMEERAALRLDPSVLLSQQTKKITPKNIRIISLGISYLPPKTAAIKTLQSDTQAYISRYALGRDYHKVLRKKLKALANKIQEEISPMGYRVFTDSAPVLEKPLAEKAGLGWIGKNTLLLNKSQGSWFFLGEIFTDLPLPLNTKKQQDACGVCKACIHICPTQAIVAPYQLDARRCISYLTIELKGSIPEVYRPLIGNRIYGCDDCQLICPWNRFAQATDQFDFHPRKDFDEVSLLQLFAWDEETFLKKTEGSPIRRATYQSWIRNIAVALGNIEKTTDSIIQALEKKRQMSLDPIILEHVDWALQRHYTKQNQRADLTRWKLTTKLNENY